MTPVDLLDEIEDLEPEDLEYFLNGLQHQLRKESIQMRWVRSTPEAQR